MVGVYAIARIKKNLIRLNISSKNLSEIYLKATRYVKEKFLIIIRAVINML